MKNFINKILIKYIINQMLTEICILRYLSFTIKFRKCNININLYYTNNNNFYQTVIKLPVQQWIMYIIYYNVYKNEILNQIKRWEKNGRL